MRKKTRSFLVWAETTSLTFTAVTLAMGIWQSSRSRSAKAWPTATGVMSKVEVKWTTNSRSRHVTEEQKSWYVDVEYEYTVRGVKYSSRKLGPAFMIKFASKAGAQEYLKKHGYQPGAEVKVYYNPKDPSDAVLQPGESSAWFCYFLAVVFAVPAVIVGLILVGPPLVALAFAAGEKKKGRRRAARRSRRPGREFPVAYTCPACGKTFTIKQSGRYKCECGRAFSL